MTFMIIENKISSFNFVLKIHTTAERIEKEAIFTQNKAKTFDSKACILITWVLVS